MFKLHRMRRINSRFNSWAGCASPSVLWREWPSWSENLRELPCGGAAVVSKGTLIVQVAVRFDLRAQLRTSGLSRMDNKKVDCQRIFLDTLSSARSFGRELVGYIDRYIYFYRFMRATVCACGNDRR